MSRLVDLISCSNPYNTQGDTVLPSNTFDQDSSRYFFDSQNVMARIHLQSDTLFQAQYVELDCDTIKGRLQSLDSKNEKFNLKCFQDRVPCKNNMELLYNSPVPQDPGDIYRRSNFQDGLMASAFCQFGDMKFYVSGPVIKAGDPIPGLMGMPYWSDQISTKCRIGSIAPQCPHNQCIYNQSEHVCNAYNNGCSELNQYWRNSTMNIFQGGCGNKRITQDSSCLTLDANYAILYNKKDQTGAGVATIELEQNLDALFSSGRDPDLQSTASWRLDLFTGVCLAFGDVGQVLPVRLSLPLFSMSFLLSMIHVFYFEMFMVNDKDVNLFYQTCSYMDGIAALDEYISILLSMASFDKGNMETYVPFWKNGWDTSSWWYRTSMLCTLPFLVGNMSDNAPYQVFFQIPFALYQTQLQDKTTEEKNASLTTFMSSLLRESEASVLNFVKGVSESAPTCALGYMESADIVCQYMIPSEINPESTLPFPILSCSFSEIPENAFLLTVTVVAEISTWSPMLYAYAQLLQPTLVLPMDSITQTLWSSSHLIPNVPNWKNLVCADEALPSCYNNLCQYVLQPPPNVTLRKSTLTTNLWVNFSAECECLRSNLTPLSETQYDNHVGMCFDTLCTNDPRTLYNLGVTESECRQACVTMDSWVHAKGVKVLNNYGQFDNTQFSSLCEGVLGLRRISFEWDWCFASFLLFFFGGFYFSFQYRVAPKPSQWIVTSRRRILAFSISLVVLTGLSVFLGFFLYGDAICNAETKQSECDSHLTETSLLPEFCSQALVCDCLWNEQCPPDFQCQSGVCFPRDPSRPPTQVETHYTVRWISLTLGIVVVIVIMSSVCTLNIPSKIHHRYVIVSAFLVLVGAWLACFFTLWFHKYQKNVYT